MPQVISKDVKLTEDWEDTDGADHGKDPPVPPHERRNCVCQWCCGCIAYLVGCLCDMNSPLHRCVCCPCRCICGHHRLDIVQHPEGATFDALVTAMPPHTAGGVVLPELARQLRKQLRHQMEERPFHTGDVIAFNDAYWGEYAMRDVGRQIQRVQQRAGITHVGIVYVHPQSDRVFVIEAVWFTDTETTPEAFTDGRLFSRRSMYAYDLFDRVEHVHADLYHLELATPLSVDAAAAATLYMEAAYVRDPPFDYATMYLAGEDCFDSCGAAAPANDDAAFFCAEFVASTLRAAKVLPPSFNASECTPADLWKNSTLFKPDPRQLKTIGDYNTVGTKPPTNGRCC